MFAPDTAGWSASASSVSPSTPPLPLLGLTLDQLGWLIRLRWLALAGILVAGIVAASGALAGIHLPVLLGVVAVAGVYNAWLWRAFRQRRAATGHRAAMGQALIDFGLLTLVLWAAGGIQSPFIAFYVFHVALVGILAGPRATLAAAGVAFFCTALLALPELYPVLRISEWQPTREWELVTGIVAYAATLGVVAYLVTHAVRELHDRERALARARDSAALEYELLSTTLDGLDAGLEVLGVDGSVIWRNRRAQQLVPGPAPWRCPGVTLPCEQDTSGICPVRRAFDRNEPGRCRFMLRASEGERVYELLSFPLTKDRMLRTRAMNLYVDRTGATLAERRLVLAERLASLGRVAQGVAHELNTPLATIRTLAADMCAALAGPGAGGADPRLIADVQESATLIKEETGRLGRITQALLAGGDLVRSRLAPGVPLSAVVERATALVFAGQRAGAVLQVGVGVDGLTVVADPDRLSQVLVNLLQNAADAVRERQGAGIVVRAIRDATHVDLVIEDDGPGIDQSVEGRLFEPFTTTKPPGEGTGLGLYISYMLVKAMRGSLHIERRTEGGTRAVVRLCTSREGE